MNENILLMRRAKEQLANKWINVALGTLIYMVLLSVASLSSLILLLVYGPLTFGYYLYIACNVDRGENNLNLLFKGFERFANTLVAGLLYVLAIFFGYCLLIVPGIILACGFSMTFFIMIDEPEISGIDALRKSWEMMKGRKWDYFCLNLRFIGWVILSILTLGIGFLFLKPYMVATFQNYYRKLRYNTY